MKFEVKKVKIVVFTPEEIISELRDAVCNEGAGVIGNYSYCTSATKAQGTYIPNENAKPYEGIHNTLEIVDEMRLEVLCDVENVKSVIKVIRKIHPYEEPCIDIVPLLEESDF